VVSVPTGVELNCVARGEMGHLLVGCPYLLDSAQGG
jgi:hypothetical protein